jgi:hypothetical protein
MSASICRDISFTISDDTTVLGVVLYSGVTMVALVQRFRRKWLIVGTDKRAAGSRESARSVDKIERA